MKRLVYSKYLVDKWIKLGYKIVAISFSQTIIVASLIAPVIRKQIQKM